VREERAACEGIDSAARVVIGCGGGVVVFGFSVGDVNAAVQCVDSKVNVLYVLPSSRFKKTPIFGNTSFADRVC
jgi:hypothetical protein